MLVSAIIDATTLDDRCLLLDLIKLGTASGDTLAIEVKSLFDQVAGTTFGEHNDFLRALEIDPFVLESFDV